MNNPKIKKGPNKITLTICIVLKKRGCNEKLRRNNSCVSNIDKLFEKKKKKKKKKKKGY